jgi:hypothetical protein
MVVLVGIVFCLSIVSGADHRYERLTPDLLGNVEEQTLHQEVTNNSCSSVWLRYLLWIPRAFKAFLLKRKLWNINIQYDDCIAKHNRGDQEEGLLDKIGSLDIRRHKILLQIDELRRRY